MPRIDISAVPLQGGSSYPEPHATEMGERYRQSLGDAAGLTLFGANLMTMKPGSKSSLRHWHEVEDEFVWIVSGELVLVQDEGETVMRPGDAAGFAAGDRNGHQFVNRSDADAQFLVVGTRPERDRCHYSDVDLIAHNDGDREWFTRRDGTIVK